VSAEGDPVTLAERRTLSFANRKIIVGSTPLDEVTSHVMRCYSDSDQRVFEVPCPSCGAFTEILWPQIEWPPDHPGSRPGAAPHCGDLRSELDKPAMVSCGRWRAQTALVSLLANASWAALARRG
jgi:phage terminase large subunit GpA-like protein